MCMCLGEHLLSAPGYHGGQMKASELVDLE